MNTSLASRLTWVREYLAGHGNAAEAAAHCQISLSQLRRWYRRYRAEGTAGLQHRLRGRPSNHRTAPKLKQRALALDAKHHVDCGPTLAAELIAERHQLAVHPETLRLWLRAAHFGTHSRRRHPHRQRRERMSAFGQMGNVLI
jgi:transposase